MPAFNRMRINRKDYPNHHGMYKRSGDFIYIETEDNKTTEVFETLLDNEVTIENFQVGHGQSITILNGPFLIFRIEEDFNGNDLIILKNKYKL